MSLVDFKRIAVIGISGSGKSTLARLLAERTGLPLHYGDQLEWCANWQARPPAEIEALHKSWIEQPRWIIEGWMDVDRIARLNRADLIIDLSYSSLFCTLRTLRRMLRNSRRDEMPPGCVDRFSWRMLLVVFCKQERPSIDAALAASTLKTYVRLGSPQKASDWLKENSAAH